MQNSIFSRLPNKTSQFTIERDVIWQVLWDRGYRPPGPPAELHKIVEDIAVLASKLVSKGSTGVTKMQFGHSVELAILLSNDGDCEVKLAEFDPIYWIWDSPQEAITQSKDKAAMEHIADILQKLELREPKHRK